MQGHAESDYLPNFGKQTDIDDKYKQLLSHINKQKGKDADQANDLSQEDADANCTQD
jgi:hypothetical protein